MVLKKTIPFSTFFLFLALVFLTPACTGIKKTGETPPPASIEIRDLSARLKAIPGISRVVQKERNSIFEKNMELWFEQAIDHKNPESPVFQQRVLLGHIAYDAPVIVEIQGYNINQNTAGELATLLDANEIRIEHRFFDPSKPDTIPWEHLTVWQAATDQHLVIKKIKKYVYPNAKFVSTGISKGGQCTMIHRSLYPDDVVASVPYVAPLNFSREDPRIYEFLRTVGTAAQRQQILDFQKLCFQRKAGLIKSLAQLQKEKTYEWDLDLATIIDYYILEYSFAFWQWGAVPFEKIPGSEISDKDLLSHLLKVSGLHFFEAAGVEALRPFFWAALTEIGMYGYETTDFAEYLDRKDPYLFDFTAPANTQPSYDPTAMKKVNDFIQNEAKQMLFIYGGLDTWGATGVVLSEAAKGRDNHVLTLADGHHETRIASFGEVEREWVYALLREWLGLVE